MVLLSIISTSLWKLFPYYIGMFGFIIFITFIKYKIEKKLKEKYGESRTERIERLTESLKEAAEVTSEIEAEIFRRNNLVSKLKEDERRYSELSKLKSQEVEAIVQTLSGELQKDSNKSLIKNTLINFSFFILGVIFTYYLGKT